jgi:hypothetical protein
MQCLDSGFTRRLYDELTASSTTSIPTYLDGPYGTSEGLSHHATVFLIAGKPLALLRSRSDHTLWSRIIRLTSRWNWYYPHPLTCHPPPIPIPRPCQQLSSEPPPYHLEYPTCIARQMGVPTLEPALFDLHPRWQCFCPRRAEWRKAADQD